MFRNPSGSRPGVSRRRLSRAEFGNLRRLLRYLGPHRGRLVVALLALLVSTGLGLVYPLVIQRLVDSVLGQRDPGLLNLLALGLVLVFAVQALFYYIRGYHLAYVGERIVVDLRMDLYEHLQQLSLSFYDNHRVGEIVSRLSNDVTVIRTLLTNNIVVVLGQTLSMIGAMIIVLVLNWRLTLFILALVPIVIGIAALVGGRLRRVATAVQDRLADSTIVLDEVLSGVRVVRSFGREQYEIGRYRHEMERTFDASMKRTRLQSAFAALMTFLGFGSVAAILWFGGQEVLAGRLTGGELISFLFYAVIIAGAAGSLSGLYTQVEEAIGATQRIFEILDTRPDIVDAPGAVPIGPSQGWIRFASVSFAYQQDRPVLHAIDLEIAPGEVLALVGPSGAGKSTILNLIPRFYDPTSGQVLVDGHDLRQVTLTSLRAQIAIVPQETLLFGGTIRENILYGRLEASEAEMVAAAQAANAHEFIVRLPEKYDTIVGERGVKLSGGQRQRIAIARALLKDPRILLLDEATSSLDSESEGFVQEALERLMRGRTTIVIAHRLSTVAYAHRIAVLDEGRVVELGTHEELIARQGLYFRLYSLQFRTEGELGTPAEIEGAQANLATPAAASGRRNRFDLLGGLSLGG